jgi:RNA polymerase sigma factor (sigma-70 family)
MPPDPLLHPIAALTDHPVLSHEAELNLLATMRTGIAARERLRCQPSPVDAELLSQVRCGDEARAMLARHNLRLVVAIAKRYHRVAGEHLTLEDLIGFGTIGLLQGIDKFDPKKAGKLSTYVTWWVRQAITRGVMDTGRMITLPVHLHERLHVHRRARVELTQQLQRELTADEITAALGWSRAQAASVAADLQDAGSLNVRAGVDDEGSELGELVPDARFDPQVAAMRSTLHGDIAQAMERLLSERERHFVRLHFGFATGQKMTLDQIGHQHGLTRERVRQVIVGALAKLRDDPVIAAYHGLLDDE